jgi:hypothetical protein
MSDDPFLTATDAEAASLRLHLAGWDELDAWPRSVSVAILRGVQTVEEIADALGVSEEEVEHGVLQLLDRGLLYDGGTRRYLLR